MRDWLAASSIHRKKWRKRWERSDAWSNVLLGRPIGYPETIELRNGIDFPGVNLEVSPVQLFDSSHSRRWNRYRLDLPVGERVAGRLSLVKDRWRSAEPSLPNCSCRGGA